MTAERTACSRRPSSLGLRTWPESRDGLAKTTRWASRTSRHLARTPCVSGAAGVFPGLKDGKLEVVPASAMAAVAFQWYTKLKYVTSTNFNIIVGGSIISQKKFDELSKADQKALLDTAARAASKLDQIVGRDDASAYETLIGRGLIEVDTAAHQAAWDSAAKNAREALAERGVYSKSLLKTVEDAAKGR
ncbi:MAG: hypothetical protein E4H00_08625 [Myxococcales bacterium]|nr:MAG: hypothetical protein E4H00_08625 [Myxococcales bacterium]